MLACARPSRPNANRMTGSAKFPLLENMTVSMKLVRVLPSSFIGPAIRRAANPMMAVSSRQNAAMRPASEALIEEPTSWLKTRHGDSALKEMEDKTFTLPPKRRSRRNPIPAMTKIGATSENSIDNKEVTDYRVISSAPDIAGIVARFSKILAHSVAANLCLRQIGHPGFGEL